MNREIFKKVQYAKFFIIIYYELYNLSFKNHVIVF